MADDVRETDVVEFAELTDALGKKPNMISINMADTGRTGGFISMTFGSLLLLKRLEYFKEDVSIGTLRASSKVIP